MSYSYGCKKDIPDERDYSYSLTSLTDILLPPKVNLIPKLPPCFNQYQTNSCVANAIAAACQYLDTSYGNLSRLFIYYNGRQIEGTQRIDGGMSIRNGVKSVEKWGTPSEPIWPFLISTINTQPSDKAYTEGEKHQAINYYRVDSDNIKTALAEGLPVIFGMVVYTSMESDKVRQTGKVPMPKWMDKVLGRHAVLIVGYDDSTEEYIVRNSWGTSWGMRGNFTLPYKYVHNPKYAQDFWVIKEVEK